MADGAKSLSAEGTSPTMQTSEGNSQNQLDRNEMCVPMHEPDLSMDGSGGAEDRSQAPGDVLLSAKSGVEKTVSQDGTSDNGRALADSATKMDIALDERDATSAVPAPQPTASSTHRVKLSPAAAEFVPRAALQSSDNVTQPQEPVPPRQQKKQRDRGQSNPQQSIHGFPAFPNLPGFTPPHSMGMGPIPQLPTNLPLAVQQQLAQQFILQREAMMLLQQQHQQGGLHPQMRPPLIPPQMPQHIASMQAQQFQGRGDPNRQFPGQMFSGPDPQMQGQFLPAMHQFPSEQGHTQVPVSRIQRQHSGEQHQMPPQQMQASPPEISEELRERLVKQVEFYLSDQNLPTDNFLMKIVRRDPQGWVPLKTIASFNKIKSLSKNQAVIAQAVRSSQELVVSPDGKKVRRAQPLPDINLFDIQVRTVVAENLPPNPTIQGMETLFSKVGKVNMVRICHPEGANSATQSAREAQAKSKDGPSLLVSTRQHALIEMGSVEAAERACMELTDRQNWRSGLQVRPLVRRQGLRKGGLQKQDSEGEGSGTDGEGAKERKGPDGATHGRGKGRGQQGQPGSAPGAHNRDPSPARPVPKGPKMPDGTKGFTFGRGRTVNALGWSVKPIGEPPAAAVQENGSTKHGRQEGAEVGAEVAAQEESAGGPPAAAVEKNGDHEAWATRR